MKQFLLRLVILAGISFLPTVSNAQLREKAEELLSTTLGNEPKEPVTSTDTFSLDEQHRKDSIKMQELALQLQEMKLNEILLKDELESTKNSNATADSLKMAEQRNRIDSLRALTPGVPVVVEGDTLFHLYAKRGGRTPVDRAEDILNIMVKIGTSHSLKKDSIYIYDSEYVTDIMYGDKVILSITDQDALWQNLSRIALAEQYQPIIQNKIQELREQHSILQIAKRVLLFILVIIIQYFLFKLTNYLFKKLRRKIIWLKQNRLRSITIRDYEFLNTHRQGRVLMFFTNVIRWIVLLIQLTISVPILFAIFPQTEDLALKIFSYLLEPVKMIFKSVASYIPNLFIILVIYYCIKYIVKGIQYIANEIESENLKISGFYPDWAQPTFNIIRFLLYAFMIAMIYPYLPGSDSGVFQGISVFVRIQLNETTGNVIEKTPFVTRLRTPKNEVVTIPNSFIMSSHTTNYSVSARQYGLIIHSTVTIGYDVPWRQVHQLLINAARQTTGVLPEPKPFVLETELSDYYPCYQINAYIKDADKLGDIYSDLHQNIQDVFNEAGVEIMSPHYFAGRDGSASTIPASPYLDDRVEPSKK